MKKPHISFVSFPHPPHVNPTLPIVSVLVRRGYRVTYVTSDRFASRIRALGAEVIQTPSLDAWVPTHERVPGAHEPYVNPFCRFAEKTLPGISASYVVDRPDIVIYDFVALSGRVLARRLDIPAIQTSPVFAHDKSLFTEQVKDPVFREGILKTGREIDTFLATQGIENGDFVFHRETLNVYLFPRALQPNSGVLGPNCFFAGRCAGEQPYYGDWEDRISGDRPISLVSTSTTYVRGAAHFKMCIEALRGMQWHVVLSIGETGDAASLGKLPENFEIVQNTAHVKILRRASLFICLGGIISEAEAMYHGVPMIILSYGFPELEWQADNIVERGLGIHLKQFETNSETLRECAVRVAKDRSLLENVKRTQCLVRGEPGGEDAANRIEEVISGGMPYVGCQA